MRVGAIPELDLPPTNRQLVVFSEIVRYYESNGEACPVSYLARRLDVDPSTVRQHVQYLHRKGFLRSAGSPAVPRKVFLAR